MQAAEHFVHVHKVRRDACKAAFTLVGGVCNINCVGYCLEKALESALCLALLCELVELLLGFDDLLFGL